MKYFHCLIGWLIGTFISYLWLGNSRKALFILILGLVLWGILEIIYALSGDGE